MKTTTKLAILSTTMFLFACLGCEEPGPKIGAVTGTITLEGEPVEGAFVTFSPIEGAGRDTMSAFKTNANGQYEMQYSIDRKGVRLGPHQVSVSTQDWEKQEDGSNKVIKERIPAWYFGPDSILEFDVKEGDNQADFDLTKKRPKN